MSARSLLPALGVQGAALGTGLAADRFGLDWALSGTAAIVLLACAAFTLGVRSTKSNPS